MLMLCNHVCINVNQNRECEREMKRKTGILLLAALLSAGLTGCGEKQWEKQIAEEEIIIEGIEGEYEFLFLTDTHVIVMSQEDTIQVEENARPRFDLFKNEEDVSSEDQFEEWISYANEEEMDGVLLGGDIIDYPSKANVTFLDSQLGRLNMPYLYTLGNHDWTYPWEYMTELGEDMYLPMLEPYMKGDTDIHVQDYGEFLIVAVDNSSNQINDGALEEYKEILAQGKPVIVLLHVPLMTQSVLTKAREEWGESKVVLGAGNYGGIYPDEESSRFVELTTAADSPVAAVLAGHVHFADRDYIDGEKRVLQIVGDAGFKGSAARIYIKGKK